MNVFNRLKFALLLSVPVLAAGAQPSYADSTSPLIDKVRAATAQFLDINAAPRGLRAGHPLRERTRYGLVHTRVVPCVTP